MVRAQDVWRCPVRTPTTTVQRPKRVPWIDTLDSFARLPTPPIP